MIPGSRIVPGEGHGNPLQISCLGIPRTEEPGGPQSIGMQRVGQDCAHTGGKFKKNPQSKVSPVLGKKTKREHSSVPKQPFKGHHRAPHQTPKESPSSFHQKDFKQKKKNKKQSTHSCLGFFLKAFYDTLLKLSHGVNRLYLPGL